MSSSKFVYYPDISDESFYTDIFKKKEFNKTVTGPEFQVRDPKEVCSPSEFRLQNHQEFARNFISSETPYNGILLFHGTGVGKTCSSMSITEGLKEYVHKMGKKIYVISSTAIKENFLRELFDERRATREKQMHSPIGSFQCVGDAYTVSELEYPDPAKRRKKVLEKIKKYYEFFGPTKFANYIDIKLKKQKKWTSEQIAEHFANSVFVIDEAHGIAGKDKLKERPTKKTEAEAKAEPEPESESDLEDSDEEDSEEDTDDIVDEEAPKKRAKAQISNRTPLSVLLEIIKDCRKIGATLKLILLTATPMKDNQHELSDLLQLLNENDGKTINPKLLFPADNTFNEDKLIEYSRGYVSYVRGNNPITFPLPQLPNTALLYEPSPLYSYDNMGKINTRYHINLNIDGGEEVMYKYNLVKCPMSLYQFKAYKHYRENRVGMRTDAADVNGRQLSNIVFPSSNIDGIMSTEAMPSNVNKLFGNSGLADAMIEQKTKIGKDIKKEGKGIRQKQHLSYEYRQVDKYGLFLSLDNPVEGKEHYNLSVFSQKFANVVTNITKKEGIAYAYSEFDDGGARTLALALEANGFVLYHPDLKFAGEELNGVKIKDAGLPINLHSYPQCRLLSYNLNLSKEYYSKYLTLNYRCAVCGELYTTCRSLNNDEKTKTKHVFRQATYIIYTGKIGKPTDIDYLRDPENINGYKIKAILGTKITGEGLDFKWIRQIHIVDPWHNNTRIYQAIGRGIRHCSHIDLEPEQRNVTIFKYASTVPEVTALIKKSEVEIVQPYDDLVDIISEKEHGNTIMIKNVNNKFVGLGITYADLLTETMDEKMYNRVVQKDIYIKRIERVLKKVAIDCALNRHINYYGENDVDYSRECDYAKCSYDCYGFPKQIEFYDLSARKNHDGTYSFKSVHEFNENVWQTNDDISEDQYSALVESASDYDIVLDPESDDYGETLFNVLKKKVGKTYLTGIGEEVHFEKSLIEVDTSTYNVHFAQPQIIKARMYIAKIFQNIVALTEKQIVNLVSRYDPLVDKEFIRLAIDQLVGNPPYIAPKEVKDKYNRSGHIIFVGGYYVFQPLDITDKKIPLYYRVHPLKIKKHHITIDSLVQSNDKLEDKIYVLDVAALDAKIEGFEKYIEYSDDDVAEQILGRVKLRMILDKMVLSDQFYILTKCIKSDRDSELSLIIQEYYKEQHLLIEHDDGRLLSLLSNKSDKVHIYNPDTNEWKAHDVDDEIMMEFNPLISRERLTILNFTDDNTQIEGTDGIYGFLAPTNVSRAKTPNYSSITTEFIKRVLNNLNSYVIVQKDVDTLKFKVVNKHNEKSIDKRDGTKSAKTFTPGNVCINFKEPQLASLLTTLKSIFKGNLSFHDKITDNELVIPPGIFECTISNVENMCNKIELALRVLDYIKYNNKKWFLSPFEIECYRPMST